MTPAEIESVVRAMLREMQRVGDYSPQVDVATLPTDLGLADCGFDSVSRVSLAALIEERFGVDVGSSAVSSETTLTDVVELICRSIKTV